MRTDASCGPLADPQLGDADGLGGPVGRSRLQGGGRPLPPLYLARLPVGASHPAVRKMKGLEGMIGLSVVHWHMGADGWTFEDGPGVIPDPVHHARFLHEIYTASQPDYTGRVTWPVLWDLTTGKIVNNESSEIIRMFNSAFDRGRRGAGRFLSRRTARRYRRAERAHLRDRQQRRLSIGLRAQPGRL